MTRLDFDDLGSRMKMYEDQYTSARTMPTLPVLARVDGRAFHTFTRGMDRPYDRRFMLCMASTMLYLLAETGAAVAYTQSDEITLAWHAPDLAHPLWFGGRTMKLAGILASMATVAFYRSVCENLPGYETRMPTFDARVWCVPSRAEAANAFVWRELDATKNSISAAAHAHFTTGQLHGKSSKERIAMLEEKGVYWDQFPAAAKRGTYAQFRKTQVTYSEEQLESLPPKHAARVSANGVRTFERSVAVLLDLPPITQIENREQVLFEGAEPVAKRL